MVPKEEKYRSGVECPLCSIYTVFACQGGLWVLYIYMCKEKARQMFVQTHLLRPGRVYQVADRVYGHLMIKLSVLVL